MKISKTTQPDKRPSDFTTWVRFMMRYNRVRFNPDANYNQLPTQSIRLTSK